MKKKLIIIAAVCCSLIAVFWIGGRVTGMLQFYTMTSPSNEPNIKTGAYFFSTNLINTKAGDFIVYSSEYSDSMNASIPGFQNGTRYVHRLCGVPGNTIQMKNGVLYVNNKNFDAHLNLNNQYKITADEFSLIDAEDMENGISLGGMYLISNDSAIVTFDNSIIKKYQSKFKLTPLIIIAPGSDCFKWLENSQNWTTDNFGPLKIPTGCYFVLGDNRHNALDSRYIGFVKKEDIKGVVLNK